MFWGKSERIAGFLDEGTHITGEVQFAGILRIDGDFHGSIAGKDLLIIGSRAVVHADIKVGGIEIHGQVFGNVEAQHQTKILAGGRLLGDLLTSSLVVQEGGVLEGRICMTSEPSARIRESTTLAVRPKELDDRKRDVDLGLRD